eukprot:7382808-Prymnesium_polylepis.1
MDGREETQGSREGVGAWVRVKDRTANAAARILPCDPAVQPTVSEDVGCTLEQRLRVRTDGLGTQRKLRALRRMEALAPALVKLGPKFAQQVADVADCATHGGAARRAVVDHEAEEVGQVCRAGRAVIDRHTFDRVLLDSAELRHEPCKWLRQLHLSMNETQPTVTEHVSLEEQSHSGEVIILRRHVVEEGVRLKANVWQPNDVQPRLCCQWPDATLLVNEGAIRIAIQRSDRRGDDAVDLGYFHIVAVGEDNVDVDGSGRRHRGGARCWQRHGAEHEGSEHGRPHRR